MPLPAFLAAAKRNRVFKPTRSAAHIRGGAMIELLEKLIAVAK
jgi:hypothetical protein